MTYRRFVPANAAASILWVSTMVILGAVFGKTVASTIDRFGIAVTTAVVIVAVGFLIRHRVKRRRVEVHPG
jgi:membrane protein DedA with SNARE-associated domain